MKKIILVLWALVLLTSSGNAQGLILQANPAVPPGGGGPLILVHHPGDQGQVRDREDSQIRKQLEQIKIWQMTKEMNLPTEKAERFFPLYNQYNDEMRSITTERRQAINSLDSAVDRHAGDSVIKDRVKHVISLDNRLASTHVSFIKSLGNILSPTEIAKYMVFEQRFDREIRQRIRFMMMQHGMRMRGR